MSVQQTATRTRSSPKQGPLRATMPISSVTKEGSALRRSTSPSLSPSVLAQPFATGRRSPGASVFYKEIQRSTPSRGIRRTASLDAIYLRGLFPREGVFWQRDRSTQTDHSHSHSLDFLPVINSNNGHLEEKLSKMSVKSKRKSPTITEPSQNDSRSSPSSAFKALLPQVGFPLKSSSRSSDEGLNKEIESYISKCESECERLKQPTPEGRKAPVADLLREPPYLRQFPQGPPNSSEDSQGSSPDQERPMSSPRINKFCSRAPPDGCERVISKSVPIVRPVAVDATHPNSLTYTLKSLENKEQPKTEDKATETETVTPIVPKDEAGMETTN